MISDEEFDRAVKETAQAALRIGLPRAALQEYAYREARAYCNGDNICINGMVWAIIDYYHAILAARKKKALDGEPVIFRRDYDGVPVALFPARPGPLQPLDIEGYREDYGFFDFDVGAIIEATTALDPASSEAAALKAALEATGRRLLVFTDPPSDDLAEAMEDIRHARNSWHGAGDLDVEDDGGA